MNFDDLKELVRRGELDAVEAALDTAPYLLHCFDLSEEQWEERTLLHCAARYGHLEIVKALVARGCEVYSHHHASYPAVFIANQYRDFPERPDGSEIVDYFLNEIPEKAEGTLGTGATIHIAARLGFSEVVRKHIALDPLCVHQRGWLGDTPLHWSSHNEHVDIVAMLLAAGADVEADEINCYGGKPLHWASEHAPESVRLLLDAGADVDAINNNKDSNYYGITPLIMNAYQRDDCAEATKLLLEAGADPNRTHNGKTALEIAEEKSHVRIAGVLREFVRRSSGQPTRPLRIRRPPSPPTRPAEGHKGTFGSALVIAGSSGMAGAASLAGQAALHGGAGLVTVAVPESIASVVAQSHPAYMTIALKEANLRLQKTVVVDIVARLTKHDAVAIGPGLGTTEEAATMVRELYRVCRLPMVIDADALNAFAGVASLLRHREADSDGNLPERILTPHPGEFARLTGVEAQDVAGRRQELAVSFARVHGVVLLLKGHRTIITDGHKVAINETGCNAMATGGAGDVLTGLLAALLASGMDAFEAAFFGAHLHGLAGEHAGDQFGSHFVTAVELLSSLAPAWKQVTRRMR